MNLYKQLVKELDKALKIQGCEYLDPILLVEPVIKVVASFAERDRLKAELDALTRLKARLHQQKRASPVRPSELSKEK